MVERSETHHELVRAAQPMMGFAALNPSYAAITLHLSASRSSAPGELDFEIRLAFAGDHPEIAVAAERGAELHLDFVRPVRHLPDRCLKRRDEAGEGAEGGLEFRSAGSGDIFGYADFRQAGPRFAAKMDFGSVGKFYYHLC